MSDVKVSVIVPVYNTEQYLKECLDSLVRQTLQEIQIVIVDDGSTDSCPQIIAEYEEKYPQKITAIRKENGGQGKARNLAFGYCQGEYIGFLDSDDYAKLDMFERMYEKAKAGDLDCVACGYTSFCIEKDKTKVIDPFHASPAYGNPKDMFFGVCASSCLHLIRGELLKDTDIRYTEGAFYEDTAFFAKLIPSIRSIDYIREAFVYRRMRANSSVTTVSLERIRQMLVIMDDINDYFSKIELREYKDRVECFCVRILLCSHLERVCLAAKRKERKTLIAEILNYIKEKYPTFKRNEYFRKGMKNLYVRTASRFTVNVTCELMRIKKKAGKKYS